MELNRYRCPRIGINTDEINYDNDTWDILVTKHHVESYNDFILNKLPKTLSNIRIIV